MLSAQSAGAPAKAQSAASEGTLEEVVVTARKRSENIQTTPVSITALSGVETARMNVRQFQDLRGLVPNLEVLPVIQGSAVNLTIRGIGQPSVQVNVDNKVGLYINDFYIARDDGNELSFYDIESTQVLKGPQGTLFGKNTTAGAVLLTTKLPTDDNSGYLDVQAGTYHRFDVTGALNIPITDNVLTRFSFRTQSTDGYIRHLIDSGTNNNINDKSGRLQFHITPTHNLTLDLLGEYNQSDTNGIVSIPTACNPKGNYIKHYDATHTVPYCVAYPPLGLPYTVYGGATLSVPTDSLITDKYVGALANSQGLTNGGHSGPFDSVSVSTVNLRMVYQINDDLSLKSITGFRQSASQHYPSTDNAPNDIYAQFDTTKTKETSQEIDLNGSFMDARLIFVAGLYYEYQDTGFLQVTGPDWIDPTGYNYDARNKFLSEAAFTQATYRVTDRLDLTLGARYNYDHKDAQSVVNLQTRFTGPDCDSFVNAFSIGGNACNGNLTGAQGHSWTDFDPRVELDYRWTPDIMTYVNYSGGYNAGGFNQQLGTNLGGGLISYDPERVWNYEGGLKSEWFDHRLRFNVTGFHQNYQNIQTQIIVFYNGVSTRAVQNGANAHEDGAEVEAEMLPTADFRVRANLAYLHQAYDYIQKGITAFTLGTPVTSAPRFQSSLAGDYTFHLPSDSQLVLNVNYRWVGSKAACLPTNTFVAGTIDPVTGCKAPAYGVLGGQLNYVLAGGNWTVGLWGTNILNKYYYLNYASGLVTNHITSVFPGRPREYGVSLRRNF